MEFTSVVRHAFVTYLRKDEVLQEGDLQKALERQCAETPPMGRLALEQRLLTMQQVFHILEVQVDTGLRFGEQAVALGYLARWQVSALLETQRHVQPSLSDILIQMGLCSVHELGQWRQRFQRATFSIPL